MNTLFPIETKHPAGFDYVENFLTAEEEASLLAEARGLDLHTFHFQGYEAKRKVASFGYDWSFEKRTLSKGKEIPPPFQWLMEKVANHISIRAEDFKELLVTEYPEGSVINWHRDAPPFDVIAGISLLSDCIFKLRPHEVSKQTRKATVSIPVRRRSLYLISDEARTAWQHSISPVKQKRYSITLRTLRQSI